MRTKCGNCTHGKNCDRKDRVACDRLGYRVYMAQEQPGCAFHDLDWFRVVAEKYTIEDMTDE